jgi:hypothetical protein
MEKVGVTQCCGGTGTENLHSLNKEVMFKNMLEAVSGVLDVKALETLIIISFRASFRGLINNDNSVVGKAPNVECRGGTFAPSHGRSPKNLNSWS